jgi:hypothetical protein
MTSQHRRAKIWQGIGFRVATNILANKDLSLIRLITLGSVLALSAFNQAALSAADRLDKTSEALKEITIAIVSSAIAGDLVLEKGDTIPIAKTNKKWSVIFANFPANTWFVNAQGVLVDEWANPIKVSVTDIGISIISPGPDGKFETTDDNKYCRSSPVPHAQH